MTNLHSYLAEIGRRGGKAGGAKGGRSRALRLTSAQRREIAIAAADKRWTDGRCRRREKRIRCKLTADGHGPEKCRFD